LEGLDVGCLVEFPTGARVPLFFEEDEDKEEEEEELGGYPPFLPTLFLP
jgi:hypothetical protein